LTVIGSSFVESLFGFVESLALAEPLFVAEDAPFAS
jgi:hypothetical protein